MQSVPVQSWTFEQEPIIRIGRSTDNHVILYSAVVSRHHVEIRQVDSGWELVNLGANGTYLDGRRITQVPVEDGVIIRLARSGPNVQIHLGSKAIAPSPDSDGESTVGQRAKQATESSPVEQLPPLQREEAVSHSVHPSLPHSSESDPSETEGEPLASPVARPQHSVTPQGAVDKDGWTVPDTSTPDTSTSTPSSSTPSSSTPDPSNQSPDLSECCHKYLQSEQLFCLDCGKPLRILGTVGEYQVIKPLEQDDNGVTQLVWRNGRSLVLRTLGLSWANHAEAIEQFQEEAAQLLQLHHPALPQFVEMFVVAGQPYLVMEPVYGRTLQQVVSQEGSLDESTAIAYLLTLCDAVDSLHQQTPPILHQDIKPENLIQRPATATSNVVLVGLYPCRSLGTAFEQATTGYTAPEQQHGQPLPASDLYALGATLVYLLTGKSPLTFYTQQEQGFQFFPEDIPSLAPDLLSVLRRLTHSEPEMRYTNAQELAGELRQLGASRGLVAER